MRRRNSYDFVSGLTVSGFEICLNPKLETCLPQAGSQPETIRSALLL